MQAKERRREPRVRQGTEVRISWEGDRGETKYALAVTYDFSRSGFKIQLMEPIDRNSYVRVQADRLQISGTAVVRNCTRKGAKYWIGLEFSGGTKIPFHLTYSMEDSTLIN